MNPILLVLSILLFFLVLGLIFDDKIRPPKLTYWQRKRRSRKG